MISSLFTLRKTMAAAAVGGTIYSIHKRRTLPDKFVLELDLTSTALVESKATLPERIASSLQGRGSGTEQLLLRDATAAIRGAAADKRVAGLVANVSATQLSLAQTQELAAAVDAFREAKAADARTFAFAAEFQDTVQYALASGFGAVYQQPSASLKLPGVSVDTPYLAGWLHKWGLRFEAVTAGAYKSGYAPLSDTSPSSAHQRAAQALLASSYEQLVRAVAKGRGLTEKQVKALGRRGGWMGSAEATQAKLLDGALYLDELDAIVEEQCGGVKTRRTLGAYHGAIQTQAALDKASRAASGVACELGGLGADGGATAMAYGQQAVSVASSAAGSAVAAAQSGASAVQPMVKPAVDWAVSTVSSLTSGDKGKAEKAAAEAAAAERAAAVAAAEKAAVEAAAAKAKQSWFWSSSKAKAEEKAKAAEAAEEKAKALKVADEAAAAKAAAETKAAEEAAAAEAAAKAKAAEEAAAPPAEAWTSRLASVGQKSSRPAIGVITLQGQIVPQTAESGEGPAKSGTISVKESRALLKAAKEDKRVKAVVLRIDSRGGEANASEAIWREVQLLKATGKPVVVSMGSVAASGGYMIAAAADEIVASPGTITGSIGVLTASLDASGFLKQQKICLMSLHEGAPPLSSARPLSSRQRGQLKQLASGFYESFEAKVMEGRKLTKRQVRRAAEGRVWTGEQALAHGLVDGLGSFEEAAARAAAAAGLAELHATGGVDVVEVKKSAKAEFSALASASAAMAAMAAHAPDALGAATRRGETNADAAEAASSLLGAAAARVVASWAAQAVAAAAPLGAADCSGGSVAAEGAPLLLTELPVGMRVRG